MQWKTTDGVQADVNARQQPDLEYGTSYEGFKTPLHNALMAKFMVKDHRPQGRAAGRALPRTPKWAEGQSNWEPELDLLSYTTRSNSECHLKRLRSYTYLLAYFPTYLPTYLRVYRLPTSLPT